MNGRLIFLLVASVLPAAGEVLIPGGDQTEWRYRTGPAVKNWEAPAFDDSAWTKAKSAAIKPGEGDAKQTTVWLRSAFEAAPESAGEKPLVLTVRGDESAVVYLNGREIARVDLAAAGEKAGRGDAAKVEVKSASIQKGANTLAVAVQPTAGGGRFEFDLAVRTDTRHPAGSAAVTDAARPATMAYYQNHFIPPDMTVPDGYVDGGRRMIIGKNAVVASSREILVIDRSKDPVLRRQLAYAKDPELLKLPTAERAKKLAQYVDRILSPGGNREEAVRAVEEFTEEYANRPVLFGEMEEACQSGVCRHRALLFKMLCDDAGLKSALVRGNYHSPRGSGGHAWNELILDDGSRVIVDVMNPRPGFAFLPETDSEAKHYVTVKDGEIYPRKKDGAAP